MSDIKSPGKYPLIRLEIDKIPDQAGRFCSSYGFDNSELKRSISQIGIINNPYIFRNSDGSIEVVTGFRRMLILKELNVNEVECFDLTDSGLSEYDMLSFAIHDNLFARRFNLVEKSIILNMLIELTKEISSINEFCFLLDVNLRDYELVLKIEGLDKYIKDSIACETLNIKALEQLINLGSDNCLICTTWINELKLNYNQQIQFIDYMKDITRINKISIRQLLDDEYYSNLLTDKKKNIPQKARELIENLRERRNPDFHRYKNLFDRNIKRLKLPKNVKINHPRYFESEFYHLEVEFKDGIELKNSLKGLMDRDELENVGDPWLNE